MLSGCTNFEEKKQRFASIVPLGNNNNATCCINDRNTVMLIVRDAASMREAKDSIAQILGSFIWHRRSVRKGTINRFRPTKGHSWRIGFEEAARRLLERERNKYDSDFRIDSLERVIIITKKRTTIEQIKSFIDEMLERELSDLGRKLEAKPTENGIKITVGRVRKRRMA